MSLAISSAKIRAFVNAVYYTKVVVNTLVSGVRDERRVECRGHSYEVRDRIDLHLPHDAGSVGLYRVLADTELRGDLFVQQAGDDQLHDLSFARRERRVTISKGTQFGFVSKCRAAALDGLTDGAQQHV